MDACTCEGYYCSEQLMNSTQICLAKWNILSLTSWKYLFYCTNEKTFTICFIYLVQRFKFLNKSKRKSIEKQRQLKQNILQARRPTLGVDACITLKARIAQVVFAPCRVLHVLSYISLVLKANVLEILNTQPNVIVNDECKSQ